MTRVMVGVVLAALFVVAVPPRDTLASPTATQLCGPTAWSGSMTVPVGMVATQVVTIGADCQPHPGPTVVLESGAVTPPNGAAQMGTIDRISSSLGPSPLAAVYGSAYVVQRTWDCCGIELNEYWVENRWSSTGTGGYITSWSGQDGYKAHRELTGGGWAPDFGNHWLGLQDGGLYYSYETVGGQLGFTYQGIFDLGGHDYYNYYWQTMRGAANGGWTCSYGYSWRKSLSFNYQAWCGSGSYPYK